MQETSAELSLVLGQRHMSESGRPAVPQKRGGSPAVTPSIETEEQWYRGG